MSNNPIMLAIRFFLELAGLFAIAYWGWTQYDSIGQIMFACGLPILAAVIWGVFRVPGEPGDAPVAVAGWLRLLIEFVFFASSVILLVLANQKDVAIVFALILVVHYALSYDSLLRLLRPVKASVQN